MSERQPHIGNGDRTGNGVDDTFAEGLRTCHTPANEGREKWRREMGILLSVTFLFL